MTGRRWVVTHQRALYLGRWGFLAQHLKRGQKKATNTIQMELKKPTNSRARN